MTCREVIIHLTTNTYPQTHINPALLLIKHGATRKYQQTSEACSGLTYCINTFIQHEGVAFNTLQLCAYRSSSVRLTAEHLWQTHQKRENGHQVCCILFHTTLSRHVIQTIPKRCKPFSKWTWAQSSAEYSVKLTWQPTMTATNCRQMDPSTVVYPSQYLFFSAPYPPDIHSHIVL